MLSVVNDKNEFFVLYLSLAGCRGDGGGPLVRIDAETNEPTLVGLLSWGRGCAKPGYPAVHTRIAAVREFIFNEVGI